MTKEQKIDMLLAFLAPIILKERTKTRNLHPKLHFSPLPKCKLRNFPVNNFP